MDGGPLLLLLMLMKFIAQKEWKLKLRKMDTFIIKDKVFEEGSEKLISRFGITSKNIDEFEVGEIAVFKDGSEISIDEGRKLLLEIKRKVY